MATDLPTYESFIARIKESDLFSAIERLQSTGTPIEVAKSFESLHLDAYWKQKDLPLTVALCSAGIQFCLTHAQLAGEGELAASLRSIGIGLAYNLGSFTWPGWDEPGIVPTREQMALGLQAAKLNLRLAVELHKPADRLCDAHWLLGAQLLAAGIFAEALEHFHQAVLPDAGDANRALFEGYVLLVPLLQDPAAPEPAWQHHLQSLQTRGDKDAAFAHEQLSTARRALLRHLEANG